MNFPFKNRTGRLSALQESIQIAFCKSNKIPDLLVFFEIIFSNPYSRFTNNPLMDMKSTRGSAT
jgi:hypothetical protein